VGAREAKQRLADLPAPKKAAAKRGRRPAKRQRKG
jgi:hypothetical protein